MTEDPQNKTEELLKKREKIKSLRKEPFLDKKSSDGLGEIARKIDEEILDVSEKLNQDSSE